MLLQSESENNFSHIVADVFGLDSAEDTKVKYQDMPPAYLVKLGATGHSWIRVVPVIMFSDQSGGNPG